MNTEQMFRTKTPSSMGEDRAPPMLAGCQGYPNLCKGVMAWAAAESCAIMTSRKLGRPPLSAKRTRERLAAHRIPGAQGPAGCKGHPKLPSEALSTSTFHFELAAREQMQRSILAPHLFILKPRRSILSGGADPAERSADAGAAGSPKPYRPCRGAHTQLRRRALAAVAKADAAQRRLF